MTDVPQSTDEDWTSLPRTGELLLRARHMASTLDDKPHHLMHDLIAEIERLRRENTMLSGIMRSVALNTRGNDNLNLEQARWRLSVINQMLEGVA